MIYIRIILIFYYIDHIGILIIFLINFSCFQVIIVDQCRTEHHIMFMQYMSIDSL